MEHWYDNEISRGILEAKYYHEGETTPQSAAASLTWVVTSLTLEP